MTTRRRKPGGAQPVADHDERVAGRLHELVRTMPTDWEAVAAIIESGRVDVTVDPGRASLVTWPLAWDMARAPYVLLERCVDLGMPVRPVDSPELVIGNAMRSGDARNVRLLIERGALVGGRRMAMGFGHVHDWCGHEAGAPFNARQWSLMLKSLLNAGANINQYDSWGRTPLLVCLVLFSGCELFSGAGTGVRGIGVLEYRERALLLIAAGANVNAPLKGKAPELGGRWPRGATPLFARPYQRGKLHRALLDAGADPLIRCGGPDSCNAIEFAERVAPRRQGNAVAGDDAINESPETAQRVLSAMRGAVATGSRKSDVR